MYIKFKHSKGKDWSIEVCGWESHAEWRWNVYLYLMPNHSLYKKDLDFLPFHCGITFDEVQTSIAFEHKYDFQKLMEWRKIGIDYSQLYDDFTQYSALDGIPAQVKNDADNLSSQLENK